MSVSLEPYVLLHGFAHPAVPVASVLMFSVSSFHLNADTNRFDCSGLNVKHVVELYISFAGLFGFRARHTSSEWHLYYKACFTFCMMECICLSFFTILRNVADQKGMKLRSFYIICLLYKSQVFGFFFFSKHCITARLFSKWRLVKKTQVPVCPGLKIISILYFNKCEN